MLSNANAKQCSLGYSGSLCSARQPCAGACRSSRFKSEPAIATLLWSLVHRSLQRFDSFRWLLGFKTKNAVFLTLIQLKLACTLWKIPCGKFIFGCSVLQDNVRKNTHLLSKKSSHTVTKLAMNIGPLKRGNTKPFLYLKLVLSTFC